MSIQDLKLKHSSRATRGHQIKNFHRRFERKVREAVGFELLGLQKVSSSLQEVGNLLTQTYFKYRSRFGLG